MTLNRIPAVMAGLVLISLNVTAQLPTNDRLRQDSLSATNPTEPAFTKVDSEAYYPGGENVWRNFLGNNLNSQVPIKKKAPPGNYTVIVQFVVDTKGALTDISALTNHGYGMEEEVIRLLKMSPRWKPAMLAGKPVKAYRKQPVTFVVVEEKGKKRG